MRPRLRRSAAALVAAIVVLAGCSIRAPREGDWVLEPVRYDNRMDGEDGPANLIDVSYPMSLFSDTAGGFWGVSSGSWLHIGAEGDTLQRFNTDPVGGITAGVAAVSPTTVVTTESLASGPVVSRIGALDTETGRRSVIHEDTRPLGAVAVFHGQLYLVAHSLEVEAMSIERMPLDGSTAPQPVVPRIDGFGASALAVAPDGTMYLATETDRYVFAPDGSLRDRMPAPSGRPAVAVSDEGAVAWITDARATPGIESFLGGGSGRAREILERPDCSEKPTLSSRIEIVDAAGSRVLPFLCDPAGFAFLEHDRLIVSVGNEGDAVLVEVTPPAPPR